MKMTDWSLRSATPEGKTNSIKKKKMEGEIQLFITSAWKWCLKPRRNNSVLKFKSDAI